MVICDGLIIFASLKQNTMKIREDMDESWGWGVKDYRKRLKELLAEAARLSSQVQEEGLEQMEKTEKEMEGLVAAIQNIKSELDEAVSWIRKAIEKSTGWTQRLSRGFAGSDDEYEKSIPTGQTEMKQLKKIEEELIALLNTSKELSTRMCVELKKIEKLINEKWEEAQAAKAQRKEEERLAAEEEERELEEAKKHSACT